MRTLSLIVLTGCALLGAPAATAQLSWSTPLQISYSSANNRYSAHPAIVLDANGDQHIAHVDFNEAQGWRHLIYMNNQTGSWVRTRLSPLTGVADFGACSLLLTPDARLHIVFAAEDTTGQNHVWIISKSVSAAAGAWSTPRQLSDDDTTCCLLGGAAVNTAGTLMVGFLDLGPTANRLYTCRQPLGDTGWQPRELVVEKNPPEFPARATLTGCGELFAASWQVGGSAYVRVRHADGWHGVRLPTTAAHGGARLAAANNGELALVYAFRNNASSWMDVRVRTSTDYGVSWTTLTTLTSRAAMETQPEAVYDAAGDLHVIWRRYQTSGKIHLMYRGRTNGSWGSDVYLTFTDTGRSQAYPNAIRAMGDRVMVVYADTMPHDGYDEIYLTEATLPTTPTPTRTATVTRTPTHTLSPTTSPTRTHTPTRTATNAHSNTPTNTSSNTPTNTPTSTPTATLSPQSTSTPTPAASAVRPGIEVR